LYSSPNIITDDVTGWDGIGRDGTWGDDKCI